MAKHTANLFSVYLCLYLSQGWFSKEFIYYLGSIGGTLSGLWPYKLLFFSTKYILLKFIWVFSDGFSYPISLRERIENGQFLCSQTFGAYSFWNEPKLCPQHISYIIGGRNPEYLVCGYTMGLRSVTYCFRITVTLTSCLSSVKNHARSTFPIFFKVKIPNLVCGYVLGLQSVVYYFLVMVTWPLASALEKLCPEHIFYSIWGRDSKFSVWMHFGLTSVAHFPGHCDFDLWPQFWKKCVRSIYPILFKVGSQILVCMYIFGLWSDAYCFMLTTCYLDL